MVSQAPPCRPDRSPPVEETTGGPLTWRRKLGMVVKVIELRLRFIALMAGTGLVFGYWDTLVNHFEKWNRPAGKAHEASDRSEYYCPMHPPVVTRAVGQLPDLRHAAGPAQARGDRDLASRGSWHGSGSPRAASPRRASGPSRWGSPRRPRSSPRSDSSASTRAGASWSLPALGAGRGSIGSMSPPRACASGRASGSPSCTATTSHNRSGPTAKRTALAREPARRPPDPQRTPLGDPEERVRLATQGLKVLGVRQDQIDAIAAHDDPDGLLPLLAPIGGHVIKKDVYEGQYVFGGDGPLRDRRPEPRLGRCPGLRGPTRACSRRPAGRGDGPGLPRRGVHGARRADRARPRPGDAHRRGAVRPRQPRPSSPARHVRHRDPERRAGGPTRTRRGGADDLPGDAAQPRLDGPRDSGRGRGANGLGLLRGLRPEAEVRSREVPRPPRSRHRETAS